MSIFKNIIAKLSGDSPAKEQESSVKATETSEAASQSSITNNAIDMRDRAIKAIVKSLKPAIGSSAPHLSRMHIWVVVPNEDFNPLDFPWADNVFKSELRLALDNAMLDGVGNKQLEINFATADKLPPSVTPVFSGELFYSWGKVETSSSASQVSTGKVDTAEGWIYVLEGTGSLMQSPFHMSAKEKKSYKIGRGISTRKYGRMRVNDIIINDSESDPTLAGMNKYVSSAQAEIVIENNAFYIKASEGGCRASGGVATKIYRDEKSTELRDTDSLIPLINNDQIELGKHVTLIFTTTEPK